MSGTIDPLHDPSGMSSNFSKRQGSMSGHVFSVEQSGWDKIPEGERLLLSHLDQYLQAKKAPLISASAKSTTYISSDIGSLGRVADSTFHAAPETLAVLGESGGVLLETGMASILEGIEQGRRAERARDPQEIQKSTQNVLMGGMELNVGGLTATFRGMGLASAVEGVQTGPTSATSLGQATFSLGMLASSLSTFWYILIGLSSWNTLGDIRRIEEGMGVSVFQEEEIQDKDKAIQFLKKELNPTPEESLQVLKTEWEKIPEPKETFENWLEEVLGQEAKILTKEFLQAINPTKDKRWDFDAMAGNLLKDGFRAVTVKYEDQKIEKLNLSKLALVGFESFHRNRMEMARTKLGRCMGKEAMQAVDEVLSEGLAEERKLELLNKICKGISSAKKFNIAAVILGGIGAGVLIAGGITACVACPPLGLIVACAIFGMAVAVIGFGLDITTLFEAKDVPIGRRDEQNNNVKFLLGIGSIVAICMISAVSLGTVPVILGIATASMMVISSVFRRIDLEMRKGEEKKIRMTIDDLKGRCSRFEELKQELQGIQEEKALEVKRQALEKEKEKIKKIVAKKLARTPVRIPSKWKQKVFTQISVGDMETLKTEMEKWKKAEDTIIGDLTSVFRSLNPTDKKASWKDSFEEFFFGVPELPRAFPNS